MKKFLKVFIIVLLVIASVAGTCYFFFKNLKEKDNTTASFAEMIYSESYKTFKNDLVKTASYVNSDKTDSRLDLIIETQMNLDEILTVLSSYHIDTDAKINNERISKAAKQLNSSKSLLQSMMREYSIKKDSTYFDRHLGANDLYKQSCNYLIAYARLLNYINMDLELNKNVDLKFTMFDIYCNVVSTSFNSTKEASSRVVIENASNINKINDIFELDNSIIVTAVNPFASVINEFNDCYYSCNKTEFAENLSANILTANSNQGTAEQVATYYFKQIFGV